LLEDDSFADATLETSNFQLNNAPAGTSVESINYTDATHAELNIAFDGTNFDVDITNFSISVLAAELVREVNLTSNELTIAANNENVSISSTVALSESNLDASVISILLNDDSFADATLETSNFQLNNVPAGTSVGSINYTDATHAELNIAFDGTDFDVDITNFSISILAAELVGTVDLTSNELTITANNESVSISSTVALSESNLDAAVIDILLEDESFADATFETSNFQLNNAPAGTSVGSINYTDATHAELNIAFDGTDFDVDITNLSISILAAELVGTVNLTSNELTITAELESGINGLDNNLKTSLYPNPNNGVFMMKYFSDRADMFDFKIINSLGKIILNKKIQVIKGENQLEFNIHTIVSGSYFIIIDTKKSVENYPFSVN